jgi:hypothetical protein
MDVRYPGKDATLTILESLVLETNIFLVLISPTLITFF